MQPHQYPKPENVFRFFDEISQIPRPSGMEKAISDYLLSFAKQHDLEHFRDSANNVIIIKEASAGREDEEPIILQGHMDMVCEKESGCSKDMEREGLDLVWEEDWISAEGTTLGGDDGIAIAIALALLEDKGLSHPRLEFVCTTEEETGMGGASVLDPAPLKGHLLLNIDSECEGILTVGCAGGVTLKLHAPLKRIPAAESMTAVKIRLSGLTGGHSGMAVQLGRANADVLMIRILRDLSASYPVCLCSISGGNKNNAIPRNAEAIILTQEQHAQELLQFITALNPVLQAEYAVTDPGLHLSAALTDEKESLTALGISDTQALLALLSSIPDGVQRMDQHLDNLVETSLNLGVLYTTETELYAEYLPRSSSDSRLQDLADRISFIVSASGARLDSSDQYPAWQFVPESVFREKMIRIFEEQYGKKPIVETVHAGLECGLLSKKIPGLDAVSIGPDIMDIHTSQEKMSISSVERTYSYIRKILEDK